MVVVRIYGGKRLYPENLITPSKDNIYGKSESKYI